MENPVQPKNRHSLRNLLNLEKPAQPEKPTQPEPGSAWKPTQLKPGSAWETSCKLEQSQLNLRKPTQPETPAQPGETNSNANGKPVNWNYATETPAQPENQFNRKPSATWETNYFKSWGGLKDLALHFQVWKSSMSTVQDYSSRKLQLDKGKM